MPQTVNRVRYVRKVDSLRPMSQRSLRLHQLSRVLDQRFTYVVPQEGIKDGDTEKAKEDALRHRRSRGLAALAATLLAGVPDAVAAERVTDRGEDDGIDGFARTQQTSDGGPVLYLVQSKWSADGNHNLGTDDIRTLVDGLRKLRTWKDLHPANPIRNFRSEVWDNGVKVPGVKVVLAWANSGEKRPSDGVQKYVQQKIRELTDEGVKVEEKFLLLKDFSDALLRSVVPTGVTVSGIMLSSHKADELKHSLQGAISAVDLGVWYQKYGERLLDDNVRFARRSRVNDEIRRTLLEEPDLFWALHGDVIAVCDTWEQSAVLGRNVPYTFHGLRIVNGAQTSAILGRALRAHRSRDLLL